MANHQPPLTPEALQPVARGAKRPRVRRPFRHQPRQGLQPTRSALIRGGIDDPGVLCDPTPSYPCRGTDRYSHVFPG
jgi:hypothetical protein